MHTFVPSTPTGGARAFRVDTGVAHYFGVGAYRRPLEDARRADVRFATECLAFANVPSDAAVDRLAPGGAARLVHHPAWKAGVPRDVGTGWDFDDIRDHYLHELFGLDPVELRWVDPERYLRISRVVPGEVMAATFGEWRRARSSCAGGLVWTLNDPVPGAGWGVFDSDGEAKAPYWYLKRALAPVAVWMTDEGSNGIAVHVANDTPEAWKVQLDVTLHRREGTAVEHGSLDLGLAPHSTLELDAEAVLGHFADAGYAFRFGPPPHDVVVATLRNGDELLSQAFHYPLGRPPSSDAGRPRAEWRSHRRQRRRLHAGARDSAPGACRRSRTPGVPPRRQLRHRRSGRAPLDPRATRNPDQWPTGPASEHPSGRISARAQRLQSGAYSCARGGATVMSDMVLDGRGTRLVLLHDVRAAHLRRSPLYRGPLAVRIVSR